MDLQRIAILVLTFLISGCSGPPMRPAAEEGSGHGPEGPVEVKTHPLVRMVEFHGHLGPYVVLGHRAGMEARRILGSPGYFDLEAEAISPLHTPQSCFIDGIQLGSGCTVGKRNLTVNPGESISAIFRSKSGKTVRIDLREDLPQKIARWIAADGVEATAHRILDMPAEELFRIAPSPGASR